MATTTTLSLKIFCKFYLALFGLIPYYHMLNEKCEKLYKIGQLFLLRYFVTIFSAAVL